MYTLRNNTKPANAMSPPIRLIRLLSPALPTAAHPSTLSLNTAAKTPRGADDDLLRLCLRDVVTRNATFVAVDET